MEEQLHIPPGMEGQLWRHQRGPHRHRPHHHVELELNLVTRGRAAYLLGERRYDLRAGMAAWLFPAQDHVLLDESPDYAMWIGVFTPMLLQRLCTSPETKTLLEANPSGQFYRMLTETQAARLNRLLEEVEATKGDLALQNAGLGYALLSAWAAFRAAAENALSGTNVHPAVEKAVRLLRDDPDAAGLEEVARQTGLSPSRLSRLFRAQIGLPLLEYRDTQRLERFLSICGRRQGVTLLEAAFEAGWGSYAQFHRVFTRRMGCSPAQYHRGIK